MKPSIACGKPRSLAPERPDLSYNLARAELSAKQPAAAIEEAENAAAEFGQDPKWRVAMGKVFLDNRQPHEAISQLLHADRQHPQDPEIRHLLAAAYLLAGQPQAVVSLLQPAAGSEDHFLLASAALAMGNVEDATKDSAISLEGGQDDPRYLLLNARIDQQRNQQQAALQTLAKAARLAPDSPEILYSQAVSYYFLGPIRPCSPKPRSCARARSIIGARVVSVCNEL